MAVADFAPVPLQSAQVSQRGILSLASFPNTDSSKVISRLYWRSFPRSAGHGPRLTKEVFENVVEDIAESTLAAEIESLGALRSAGVAECIVPATFVRIADDLVGFVQLFEFSSADFSVRGGMQVRVMLASEFSEGFLTFVVGRVPFDTEGFVIIAFCHGRGLPVLRCNRTKPHRP